MTDKTHGWKNRVWLLGAVLALGALAWAFLNQSVMLLTVGPDQKLWQVIKDVPPGSRAFITVLPGTYPDGTNLMRNGVDWHFQEGAVVSNRVQRAGNDAVVAIFDDRYSGAVTCNITGKGTFIWDATDHDLGGVGFEALGMLVLTNPASQVSFQGRRVEMFAKDGPVTGAAAFHIRNCRKFTIDLDEMEGPEYGENDADSVAAPCVYWERGDVYGRIGHIKTEGYGVWCNTSTDNLGVTNDLYLEGHRWQTTLHAAIYTSMSNDTHRAWFNVKEVETAYGAFGTVTLYDGGKTYVNALLISGRNNVAIRADNAFASGVPGCEAWVTSQKIKSNTGWLINSKARLHLTAQQYEDTGEVGTGFYLTNGATSVFGGVARVLNGKALEHFGGTNRFVGVTLDTRGTNALATVTNNRPVTLAAGTSNLVLQSCALLSPIATAGGGAYSLFATSGVANVLVYNGGLANSNWSAGINIAIGSMATNQTMMR